MHTPITFLNLKPADEEEDAKRYATEALMQGLPVTPCMVIYKYLDPALAVYFPPNTPEYPRTEQIADASLAASAAKAEMTKLILDVSIPSGQLVLSEPYETDFIDALLLVYSAESGAAVIPLPYRVQDGSVTWLKFDMNSTAKSSFFKNQRDLFSFAALQFVVPTTILHFAPASELLESKGFKLEYLEPFNADNFIYTHQLAV